MTAVRSKRKAFVAQKDCVACGCCVKVCPFGAIRIIKGITARVDMDRCIGCGKCVKECPASIIEIREVCE
ncbi:MAG: 4Fe-4S binding protein [Clostridiales bacterium]|nr:4Fe-4S binding protein [Clostridiales bacterium]